jgi:hypothetical protein
MKKYIFIIILIFVIYKFTTFSNYIKLVRLFDPLGIRQITNKEYIKKSSLMADKLRIKDVIKHIPNLHYAKVLGVYKNTNEINFDVLPQKFVIKVNHWSGDCIVVDKEKITNWNKFNKKISKRFNNKLNQRYNFGVEYHYKYIKPQLFIEEHLNIPKVEYLLHIIHGKVVFIFVKNGGKTYTEGNMYSRDWKELDLNYFFPYNKKNSRYNFKKPKTFEQLIKITETIGKQMDIKYARIDFYIIEDKIYFAEITLTNLGLFFTSLNPNSFDKMLLKFYLTKKINYNEINKYLVKK